MKHDRACPPGRERRYAVPIGVFVACRREILLMFVNADVEVVEEEEEDGRVENRPNLRSGEWGNNSDVDY